MTEKFNQIVNLENVNNDLIVKLNNLLDQLEKSVEKFQNRKEHDRQKAYIGHYSIKSRIEDARYHNDEEN